MYAILRKTYGYGKKEDDMTVTQIANLTGITRPRASEALSALDLMNAVRKTDGRHGYVLSINKNYTDWQRTKNVRVRKTDGERTKNVRTAYEKRTHKRQPQKTTPKDNGQTTFGLFWSAYPRKVKKEAARKAWLKLNPDDLMTARIVKAVEAHKRQTQWATIEYVPHPATWINARQWEDEIKITATPAHQPFGVYGS